MDPRLTADQLHPAIQIEVVGRVQGDIGSDRLLCSVGSFKKNDGEEKKEKHSNLWTTLFTFLISKEGPWRREGELNPSVFAASSCGQGSETDLATPLAFAAH